MPVLSNITMQFRGYIFPLVQEETDGSMVQSVTSNVIWSILFIFHGHISLIPLHMFFLMNSKMQLRVYKKL